MSFYFGKQLHFLLNTSPGYRTERILRAELLHENKNYLRSETEEKRNERFARQDRIKQLLNECPHIEMWMSSHYSILRGSSICMLLNDQDTRQPMLTLFPSPQFFQLYDLKVLEGEIPQNLKVGVTINGTKQSSNESHGLCATRRCFCTQRISTLD